MKKVHCGIAVGAIVTIVACIGLVAGILALIFVPLKTHPVNRIGMELMKNDPAVAELFGSPLKGGLLVVGTIRGYRYGGDTANLETSISGPLGHGTAFIYGTEQEDGTWRIQSITIRIGREVVLSYSGSEPQKGFEAPGD